jgi:hypothetical protein
MTMAVSSDNVLLFTKEDILPHKNPEERKAYHHRYFQEHFGSFMEKKRDWRKKNPLKWKEYRARVMAERGDAERKRRREYYRNNHEARKRKLLKNAENAKKFNARLRLENRALYMLRNLKKSIRHPGKNNKDTSQFDITEQWFRERLNANVCEMSGLPFELEPVRNPFYPTVDRIDPLGPYTQANCRLVIWYLNKALDRLGEDFAADVFIRVLARKGYSVTKPVSLGKVA